MSSAKHTILGFCAVMVSNTCQLAHSYLAKMQPVTPGEIIASRALLQIAVFGLWELCHRTKREDEWKPALTPKTWVAAWIANILLSTSQIIAYTAVKMIPLSDFVVLCFTSPVFALIASAILMR